MWTEGILWGGGWFYLFLPLLVSVLLHHFSSLPRLGEMGLGGYGLLTFYFVGPDLTRLNMAWYGTVRYEMK